LLAGRKLLLADDSITIQKVVDLTFADEGVSVVCVNNGREAIERLEEFLPDVILADVFMPQVDGYELCEHIKTSDKLKHIPVMLLVGSFEPFDEEEARRVGANDTLTKPFQSIRRLIDKVALLVSGRPPEEQIPTAELPKPDLPEPEVETLSTAELEISTADTQPLPAEFRHIVGEGAQSRAQQEEVQLLSGAKVDNGMTEATVTENRNQVSERYEGAGEVLLDLGFEPERSALDDDFVLDIDLDEVPETPPFETVLQAPAFSGVDSYGSIAQAEPAPLSTSWSREATVAEDRAATSDQFVSTQEFQRILDEPTSEPAPEATLPEVEVVGIASEVSAAPTDQLATRQGFQRIVDEQVSEPREESSREAELIEASAEKSAGRGVVAEQYSPETMAYVTQPAPAEFSLQQLSPEMIDAIARRAVEHLSEKVVQEIAWEVVPQMAELLIKRQLEEKNS
jgi:CheY-like chemotaxis protein